MPKAALGAHVSTPGDGHRQKQYIAYCVRLLVPGAVTGNCKAEENQTWKKPAYEAQEQILLGWAPQLGVEVAVGPRPDVGRQCEKSLPRAQWFAKASQGSEGGRHIRTAAKGGAHGDRHIQGLGKARKLSSLTSLGSVPVLSLSS